MHKRFFVAIMAVLLIAGMVSSTACEMTCTPTGQMAACCAQQIRQSQITIHSTGHCEHANTTSLTSARQCGHPQQSPAIVTAAVQAIQPHAAENISTSLTALASTNSIAASSDISSVSILNRSSFIAPLRI
jgi:hypothetical protein